MNRCINRTRIRITLLLAAVFLVISFCAVFSAQAASKKFYSVAHMGYNKTTHRGRNLLKSFKAAKKHGFNAVECDIQITKDGVFILSHEDTITDPETGIAYPTWKTEWEVLKELPYYDSKLTTFKKLLSYCKKNNMHIYIDKMGQFKSQETWDKVFALVDKYKMQNKVTWLLYREEDAARVFEHYPKGRVGFLILHDYMLETVIERANNVKTSKNKVFINFLAGKTFPPEVLESAKEQVKKGITFEVWNVGSNKQVYKNYLPYVSGVTSDYYCRKDIK